MKKLSLRLSAVLAASLLLLAACGGGGDDGPVSPYGRSSQFAEVPGRPESCSVDRQKRFVRAYLDEVYLWYREIPQVDAAQYTTVGQIDDYFDALIVRPKDPWSTALFTGVQASASTAPQAQIALDDLVAMHAVPAAPTITTVAGRRVGYLQLRNHDAGSQDELIAAVQQLQAQGGVQDLVLDLRDNVGGFLYVALTGASMIAPASTDGQIFERLVFNDKRGENAFRYSGQVQFADGSNAQYPVGATLPRLGLPRVLVLTGGDTATGRVTCSASESIINGLRGVGVEVIRLGQATCGKPYGFTEKANCGYSFYAVEFQGFNAQGFGDYTNGFQPHCLIPDQVAFSDRGTAADPVYQGALQYVSTGACPAGTDNTANAQRLALRSVIPTPRQSPLGARLLLPEQSPR